MSNSILNIYWSARHRTNLRLYVVIKLCNLQFEFYLIVKLLDKAAQCVIIHVLIQLLITSVIKEVSYFIKNCWIFVCFACGRIITYHAFSVWHVGERRRYLLIWCGDWILVKLLQICCKSDLGHAVVSTIYYWFLHKGANSLIWFKLSTVEFVT